MNKHKINKKIQHQAPSQRRHHRMTIPLWVEIEDKQYKTIDWSVAGFSVENFQPDVEIGKEYSVFVIINFQGFYINFEVKAKVARIENNLTAFYLDDTEKCQDILQYFAEKNITGELVNIDDVFRHIDVPVSKTNLNPDFDENLIENQNNNGFRRKAIISLYLTLGMVLATYLSIMSYSYFRTIRIDSAVVDAPVEAMMAVESGLLTDIYIEEGDWVEKGSAIYKLYDPKLEHELEKAQISVDESILRRDYVKMLVDAEYEKISIYEDVSETKEKSYVKQIENLKERYQLFKNKLQRTLKLRSKGYLSDEDLDKAMNDYIYAQNELLAGNKILTVENISQSGLKDGHYFSDGKIEGQLSNLKAEYEKARAEVQFQFKKFKATKKYYDQLIFKAPFSGRVLKHVRTIGGSVDKGDAIVLLEKDEKRLVNAYLTQSEVVDVGLGDKVALFIPALDVRLDGKIIEIDRTAGFVDEMERQFRWRKEADRSALISIDILDLSQDDIKKHVPNGTPVIAYFKRRMTSPAVDRFINFIME